MFASKDAFDVDKTQQAYQEITETNSEVSDEELKVQVIPDIRSFLKNNIQKGMDQYIIEFKIRKSLINAILNRLRRLSYTDKAKKLGKKPIIFKHLLLWSHNDINDIIEETDEFSIEGYSTHILYDLEKFDHFYKKLISLDKPIELNVNLQLRDSIEKNYDLSNCKITYYE